MKFETGDHIEANGTSLKGYIHNATYNELVELFGEPTYDWGSDGDKVQVEWVIRFKDGTIATIYDWKQYGTPVENITEWNIGGHKQDAVDRTMGVVGADKVTRQHCFTW
jgi:hypothetical protein